MNKSKLAFSLAAIAALLLVVAVVFSLSPNTESNAPPQPLTASSHEEESVSAVKNEPNSIAEAWQWRNFPKEDSPIQAAEPQPMNNVSYLDAEIIFQALQSVRLDENGDVILDHQALLALNQAFSYSGDKDGELNLDSDALAELTYIIEMGLPGKAGKQTSNIVEKYYQYLGAESEFNRLYENGENSANSQQQYQELQSIRELYLGTDVANKLFSVSDANARYMFKSMELASDVTLTDQDRQDQQAANIKQHQELTLGVDNWGERYQDFLAAKQEILAAAMSDSAKRDQIAALMHEHFSDEELNKVEHLSLGEW